MTLARERAARLAAVPGAPLRGAPTAPAAGADAPDLALAWAPVLEGLPQPAWLVRLADRRVCAANAAAAALFGLDAAALCERPADELLLSPEDAAWWAALGDGGGEPPEPLHSDTVLAPAGGGLRHVTRSIRALPAAPAAPGSPATAPTHALVTLADRSAAQRAEAEREALLAEMQATLESTSDGILVTDLDGGVRHFNRRFAELWDLPPALLAQRDDVALRAWMQGQVAAGEAHLQPPQQLLPNSAAAAIDRLQLASGRVLERASRPLWLGDTVQGRVHAFRDLTERIATDQRLQTLALTDALTGLPNRRALVERIAADAQLARERGPGAGFAVVLIDLDRFRQVNQSLGHGMGDQVLCAVAARLREVMREDDVLARSGGDQFVALVAQADERAAEVTARRLLEAVSRPLLIGGTPFTLTCSIGVALCPSHGRSADELLRCAELAMRAVKFAGRGHWRLHQARTEVDRRLQLRLDHAMRQALASKRFRLQYQPQVSLVDGRVIGAEALLRWRDPELGEVPPARFIPVAEESGFIVAIGDWVLGEAVRQAALWLERGHRVPIAVNVSALQFQQRDFVDNVANVLAISGLPAELLELELTESVLVSEVDDTVQRLQTLASLGVRLSIDDFGTGYSVVSLLKDKRFPIRTLKIDRSFVAGLPEDGRDAGIVRGMLQMAAACDMTVIAEGVETEAQRDFLRAAGCEAFQGWLFAPALDSLSFEQRLLQAPGAAAAAAPPPRPPVERRASGRPVFRLVGS